MGLWFSGSSPGKHLARTSEPSDIALELSARITAPISNLYALEMKGSDCAVHESVQVKRDGITKVSLLV